MKVAVYGSGYVGLVVAACLADTGLPVVCVEIDRQRLHRLHNLDLAGEEAALAAMVERTTAAGTLHFTDNASEAVAEVVFICVGTPASGDGAADLSAVSAVAKTVAEQASADTTVFVKSTVPPGTCAQVERDMRLWVQQRPATGAEAAPPQIEVVANPEFLREGMAVADFSNPERVMIGSDSDRARRVAEDLYGRLGCGDRLIFARSASAELAKCTANAFLAARVAMINDAALLADRFGADIEEVRQCVGADSRIGSAFLAPGNGFGGSCFGKDLQSLDHIAAGTLESGLYRSILRGNEQHSLYPLAQARAHFGDLRGLHVCLWGLAFKAGTADTRDSTALVLAQALLAEGATLAAQDPAIPPAIPQRNDRIPAAIELCADPLAAAKDADLLILCTAWPEFATVDLHQLRAQMRQSVLIDTSNQLDPAAARQAGFAYMSTGRST